MVSQEPTNRILQTLPASSVSELVKKARELPVLTREEVIELFWRIRAGDKTAREKMLLSNLRLVAKQVARYYSNELTFFSFGDLFNAGMKGLIKTVERFDERKGNTFSTYAMWWIRQAISMEIQRHKRPIRIPPNVDRELWAFQQRKKREERRQGRSVSIEEVLREMGWSAEKERQIRGVLSRDIEGCLSLDMPAEENGLGGGETGSFGETVTTNPKVEAGTIHRLELQEDTKRYLGALSGRGRQIIEMLFGLNGFEEHTRREIAKELKVSRQRVSQMEERAMLTMRRVDGIEAPAPKKRKSGQKASQEA